MKFLTPIVLVACLAPSVAFAGDYGSYDYHPHHYHAYHAPAHVYHAPSYQYHAPVHEYTQEHVAPQNYGGAY